MLVTTVPSAVQFHSLSDTCKKAKNGQYKCRCVLVEYLRNAHNLLNYRCCHVRTMTTLVRDQMSALMLFMLIPILLNGQGVSLIGRLPPCRNWIIETYTGRQHGLFSTHAPCNIFDNNHQLHPNLQDVLPDDVVERINSFNDNQQSKFIDSIKSQNCYLVEFSPIGSVCLQCNTNTTTLGASEQARAVLFYLLKYITKDATPLAQAVAMAAAARCHIDVYPSVAEDHHTTDRRAKYFVQRLTNSLIGMTEVLSPQAASSLLGMGSSTSSINTIFCFVRDAIRYQESALIAGHNATEQKMRAKR
jgi:hypothetical protein